MFLEIEALENLIEFCRLDISKSDKPLLNCSPDINLITPSQKILLGRFRFLSFCEDAGPLYFPAFLTQPNYLSFQDGEKDKILRLGLVRYSSDSGTASGLSVNKATLHALLERKERDAIGMKLIRTVISRDAFPVRRFRLTNFPTKLASICDAAATEVNGKLSLWVLTSDIGIATTMAAWLTQGGHYFGNGTWLSREYSVETAVVESG